MKFNKKQGQFLNDTISHWEANGTITKETAETLKNSFSIRPFDYKKLAKYSFWIAVICAITAFGAIIADDYLIDFVERIFSSSSVGLCLTFAVLAAAIYYAGLKRRQKKPERVFSNETIIFFGVLFTAASVVYLGKAIDTGSGHFSILFLLSTAIYAVLALWFPSKLVWLFSLISLGCWFGAETGYVSGWGAYFLGMNYPLRFVLFGGILVGASFFLKNSSKLSDFYKPTYTMGLLYLFIALWILSIFGNYGDMSSWYDVKQIELFHWGIVFGLAAIGAIFYGLKYDDSASRSFGITFLFINLYTKYFEFFWDATHKALFFTILAASFWFVGRQAEKIWNLEFLKKNEQTDNKTDDKNSNDKE
jgi:MFS family permease